MLLADRKPIRKLLFGTVTMEIRCSKCGGEAVEDEHAVVCLGCGCCISEDSLFTPETGPEGQQCGHYVAANGRIPGEGAGRNSYHTGLLKTVSPDKFPAGRAFAEMSTLVNRMGCTNQIKQDALYYMESAYLELGGSGRMPLERMAAACLYIAVRKNRLPVTLTEVAGHIGKHVTGADCKAVLCALEIIVPASDFHSYIQRYVSQLPSLCNSKKKATVVKLSTKLKKWLEPYDAAPAANTPEFPAVVLLLVAKSQQIKLTAKAVALVCYAKPGHISKQANKINSMLANAAQTLPWLTELKVQVTPKNVISHLSTIVCTSASRKKPGQGNSPTSADQNKPPGMQPQAVHASTDATASAGHSGQADCGSNQINGQARKRQRAEIQSEGNNAANSYSTAEILTEAPKRARFSTENLDAKTLEREQVIADHEMGRYLFEPAGQHVRRQTREQQQASMC